MHILILYLNSMYIHPYPDCLKNHKIFYFCKHSENFNVTGVMKNNCTESWNINKISSYNRAGVPHLQFTSESESGNLKTKSTQYLNMSVQEIIQLIWVNLWYLPPPPGGPLPVNVGFWFVAPLPLIVWVWDSSAHRKNLQLELAHL